MAGVEEFDRYGYNSAIVTEFLASLREVSNLAMAEAKNAVY
jgi:hypothetical protein